MSLIWTINQHPSNVKAQGLPEQSSPHSRAKRSGAKVLSGSILTFPNSVLLFGSIPSWGWNFVLLQSNPWDMTEAFPWSMISIVSSAISRWFLIVNTFSGVLCQKWRFTDQSTHLCSLARAVWLGWQLWHQATWQEGGRGIWQLKASLGKNTFHPFCYFNNWIIFWLICFISSFVWFNLLNFMIE